MKTFLHVDAEAGLTLVCTHRCHTLTEPEGAVGVRMWVFCFIHDSFELCDYAYDVVCDRFPLDALSRAWTRIAPELNCWISQY